jgi:hypothetical protein
MPAIVPGWEACLCRCHRRRRRKRALSPPFPFLSVPHRPRAADARRAAVELQSAAPPACSVPFYPRTNTFHPHEPGTAIASTHWPPCARTQGHPRPEPCPHRARRRPELCRGGQEPFQATQGGKTPALGEYAPVETRHDQNGALDFDWRRRRRPSPRRHPHRRRRFLSCRAAARPWPRSLTSKGKTNSRYTSPSLRSHVGPAERTSPPASRCRAAAVSGISSSTPRTRGGIP